MLKRLSLKMENGEKWEVSIDTIARSKAEYRFAKYPDEFLSFEQCRDEIIDEFNQDPYEAEDWMKNNMNWSELNAVKVFVPPKSPDFIEDWMNSEVEYIKEKGE